SPGEKCAGPALDAVARARVQNPEGRQGKIAAQPQEQRLQHCDQSGWSRCCLLPALIHSPRWAGVVKVKLVLVTFDGVTEAPPRVTVMPETNPYPLTVTTWPPPTGPAAGVSDVITGGAFGCTLCSTSVW